MKTNILLLSAVFMLSAFSLMAQAPLTKTERKAAVKHLKQSRSGIEKTVKGLSEGQMNFKPSDGSWSIAECIEHIAVSEMGLFSAVEGTLQNVPDPSLRSEVKMSDTDILSLIEDRSEKVKTRPEGEPTNRFESLEGSLKAFLSKRDENIKYVETTPDDLRNRYFDFPFGKVDSYQVILFMSGHSVRHLNQIKEIMANQAYPTS